MNEENHKIDSFNSNLQGQLVSINFSHRQGIIIEESNQNNEGWKIQVSLDNATIIELHKLHDLTLLGKCDNQTFLERLIRDINSEDLITRRLTAESLCYYIEINGLELPVELLFGTVNKMIERLTIENDSEVEQKLSEGIFEFIWFEKLNKDEERNLIIKLAKMDKDALYCYLDDEDYLLFEEVKEFINRGRK